MDDRQREALIESFKAEYNEVYLTAVGADEFIFRAITPKEHDQINQWAVNEDDALERVCEMAVLWPKMNFQAGKAYIPTQLAPMILEKSGFGGSYPEVYLIPEFRSQMNDFYEQAKIVIATAFPNYKFEEMDDWTKEKIIQMAVRAEWQLRMIRGLKQFQLVVYDPNAVQEGEAPPEKTLTEIISDVRKNGEDPMFVLRHLIPEREPYLEKPIIGGSRQVDTVIAGRRAPWEGVNTDGRYDIIREQVQKISRRRNGHLPKG